MSGLSFYLAIECQNCDETVHYGPNLSFHDDHRGLPVIYADMTSQVNFHCDHCGADNYTGDFHDQILCEGGDDQDEDEEDDGDEPARGVL
ncbi:hypothetical protein [Prauserella endophytica]|uniref:C2H2-type domain-containing protein n=1 Tax=Prauserella endophytica TaxID=1592324 RepID=A0ABY2S0J2_9PSEU|nr:hypothetical protein [Prauserella endophytica]TKG67037.1 hypothetical protein FCN18_24335 [Prauserella endophytica]